MGEVEKRLIYAEKLKNSMFAICEATENERIHIDSIIDIIDNAEDVNAMEVVHGRWTDEHQGFMYYDATCSVCGKHNDSASKFCPNCGAKMDGVFDG